MKKFIFTLGVLTTTSVFAQSQDPAIWQAYSDSESQAQTFSVKLSAKNGLKKQSLLLDEVQLKHQLSKYNKSSLKLAKGSESTEDLAVEIDLPLPDGSFVKVKAVDSPILSDELAEKYPEIKTWKVTGIDDPAISGRIDFTSKGFHGMLVMGDGDTIYIDPDVNQAGNVYNTLSKRENADHFHTEFNCEVHDDHKVIDSLLESKKLSKRILASTPALDLKTYRFAVAGTAEYTASQGGTTASAYASMVTTVNRVNQLYQNDLGIRLELVSGEQLIYTNAATDPYTNNNANSLVSENMSNMSANFGLSNFDLGHVFAQGSLGGLAFVGVACINSANTSSGLTNGIKAGGATGTNNPQGEIFSVEYVAHEVGHQLGATHTFNSTQNGCGGGNRTAETAVEPGSGSTVMAYSGLCGSDDLQFNSEAYFHFASISQINDYTRSDLGSSCGTNTSTGNQNPSANAGADINIPANTPFLLDGSSSGGSSYTWDQTDTGSASPVDVDMGNNAIIRTLLPSSEEDRYIPRLSDLFAGTSTIGEKLPQTTRELNFTYVVRDGSGGVGTDDKKINVTDTNSTFTVVSQSSNEVLSTGQSINVLWNTASTNVAPVSCSTVDIHLIRENGVRNILLEATSNDGNQQLTIPGATPAMSAARIMVACSDNSFFNISTGDITIQQGVGDVTPPTITLLGVNPVSIPQGSVYTDAGATANDDIDGAVTVSTSGTVNTAVAGTYTLTYSAVDAAGNASSITREVNVTAVITPDTTAPVITLVGSSTVNLTVGSSYTEAGATATDNVDGTVAVSISGTVNTAVVGTYTLTYSAVDAAGNTSSITREVNVTAVITPDTSAPVITLVGSSTVNLTVGSSYSEAGATATDNVDGTVAVSISGTVNTAVVGTYTLTYSAVDAAGNASSITREVNVTAVITPDTSAPVITLVGSSTVNLTVGSSYSEAGATATDNIDGSVTVSISGTVNTAVAGTYTLTYSAVDAAGNASSITREVNVTAVITPDTSAPVITLVGSSTVNLTLGSSYSEAGATATDNIDGSVTVSISGSVNTAVAGTYTLTYSAVDAAGNASSITREVNVTAVITPDTSAPVITLVGSSTVNLTVGSSYTEAGATATDNVDGSVTVSISGTVNTAVAGTYTLTYSAVDAAGNASSITREVNITAAPVIVNADTTAPVITLNGSSSVTLTVGDSYTDEGATAIDNVDGAVNVSKSGIVNTIQVGSYNITYSAQDAAGNTSTKIRTVVVIEAPSSTPDTVEPVIVLEGGETVTINIGESFSDPGYSAFDDIDGIINVTVTGMDEVDSSKAGEYVITYTAIDSAGNTIVRQRTVVVEAVETHDDQTPSSSGGGSFGFLLMPTLMILRLRRQKKLLKKEI